MKFTVRFFALSLILAGAAAASVSSNTTQIFASRQAATSALPTPMCGPHVPTCPTQPDPSVR